MPVSPDSPVLKAVPAAAPVVASLFDLPWPALIFAGVIALAAGFLGELTNISDPEWKPEIRRFIAQGTAAFGSGLIVAGIGEWQEWHPGFVLFLLIAFGFLGHAGLKMLLNKVMQKGRKL